MLSSFGALKSHWWTSQSLASHPWFGDDSVPGAGSNYILASRPRSQRVGVADSAIFCRKAKLQVWGTPFVLVLVQIGWNSSTKQYANSNGGCNLEIRTMCECFCLELISKPRPLFVMLFITISAGGGGEVMVVSVSFSCRFFLFLDLQHGLTSIHV